MIIDDVVDNEFESALDQLHSTAAVAAHHIVGLLDHREPYPLRVVLHHVRQRLLRVLRFKLEPLQQPVDVSSGRCYAAGLRLRLQPPVFGFESGDLGLQLSEFGLQLDDVAFFAFSVFFCSLFVVFCAISGNNVADAEIWFIHLNLLRTLNLNKYIIIFLYLSIFLFSKLKNNLISVKYLCILCYFYIIE